MHSHFADLMRAEGLPYGERTHTYNSRLAQELGKWADTQPGFDAIHDVLYSAYFVEDRNIGDIDELVALAQSVGLPADAARECSRTEVLGMRLMPIGRSPEDTASRAYPLSLLAGMTWWVRSHTRCWSNQLPPPEGAV